MTYTFKLMNQKDAEIISKWQYSGSYSFYNAENDAEDLEELLDPEQRGYHYYSAFKDEELAGFFTFYYDRFNRDTVIGLGLAPHLTGKGLGGQFIHEGMDFGLKLFPGTTMYKLSVACFNKRAITIYQRNGFQEKEMTMVETNGGLYRFLQMEKAVSV